MRTKSGRHAQIAHIADGQHGWVRRRQLLDAGVAASTIRDWVDAGLLFPEHAGVYGVGHRRSDPIARAAAAVLAGWPAAVLSHDSAAALWGLRRWPQPPEVTSLRAIRRPGIAAHRSRTLTDADVTVQHGIATTTVARTLNDIRPRITTRRRFERLVNQARLAHQLGADEAFALLGHHHRPTRSGGEDLFPRFCARQDLPIPVLNAWIVGHEVDALFSAHRVIVEIDHYATHGDPASFETDRIRDAELQAAGYRVVRVTEARLRTDPRAEADRLRRILRHAIKSRP